MPTPGPKEGLELLRVQRDAVPGPLPLQSICGKAQLKGKAVRKLVTPGGAATGTESLAQFTRDGKEAES